MSNIYRIALVTVSFMLCASYGPQTADDNALQHRIQDGSLAMIDILHPDSKKAYVAIIIDTRTNRAIVARKDISLGTSPSASGVHRGNPSTSPLGAYTAQYIGYCPPWNGDKELVRIAGSTSLPPAQPSMPIPSTPVNPFLLQALLLNSEDFPTKPAPQVEAPRS